MSAQCIIQFKGVEEKIKINERHAEHATLFWAINKGVLFTEALKTF